MKFGKKVAALALGVTLALGVATPALAEDVTEATVENQVVKDAVTKVLKTNDGSTVTETFAFTASAIQVDVEETGKSAPVADCPAITIDSISYTDGGKKDGDIKKIDIDLSKVEFLHAGVYAYTVAETSGSTDGMTYDTQTYTMRVYVENDNGSQVVKHVTLENVSGEKVSTATFNNSYVEEAADLVISKTTTGATADLTKQFKIKVTFTNPTDVTGDTFTITGAKGETAITITDGVAEFTLANGETATFKGMQAGTTYTIEELELATTNYTPSGVATENGTAGENQVGTKNTDFKAENKLVGENTNRYDLKNEASNITPTSLVLDNAPFLMMGAVAVAGVVLYGAAKRKVMSL